MPWKALPLTEKSKKEALSNKYKVRGIPTLVILDEEGRVIVTDGVPCNTAENVCIHKESIDNVPGMS